MRVYSSIKDIPEKIDLAFIIISRRAVPKVIRECAEKGIKAVVVVADGFAERDREGAKLQNEIVEIAREAGIRIIGPNTRLGIVTFTGGGAGHRWRSEIGLSVAELSPETTMKLNTISPDLGKTILDIGPPMAVIDNYTTIFSETLKTLVADDNIGCLFNVIWISSSGEFVEEYLRIYQELKGNCQKPIATWIYGPRLPLINELACRFEDVGFPVFSNLETAINALGIAYQYAIWKKGEA